MDDFPLTAVSFALFALLALTVTAYSPNRPGPRISASLTVATLISLYLSWRIPQLWRMPIEISLEATWIWLFVFVELTCLADLLVCLLLMSRITDRVPEADEHEQRLRALPVNQLPHVDVWIATYNEEWAILEKTLVGCKALDWPSDRLHIWVLDDGRRDWLRDRCDELKVGYIRRTDNKGKKAGNHNNALAQTKAPYILSLDADFVPFPNILYRTIGFFQISDIGIVQTPQCYYNLEPMRRNMELNRVVPEELDMFYKVLQPCRDAWNASFYCGSSAVLCREALDDIGGFETVTDIEDQATSIKLLANGWKTRYLSEPLSVGLAPESSAALHDQRNRWCRGSLQILFLHYGPFGHGLSFLHRLLFLQSYWILGSLGPIIFTLTPILIWIFGWQLFPVTQHGQVILLPLALFATICTFLTWISHRTWLPVISPAFHLFMAVEMLPTAVTTLIKPFGKSLIRILPVTLKGSEAGGGGIDVRTFGVLAAMMIALLGGMAVACIFSRNLIDHPLEIVALIWWSTYSLAVLAVAMRCCIEPTPNSEHWFNVHQTATVSTVDGATHEILVTSLSLTGAQIDWAAVPASAGTISAGVIKLWMKGIGEIDAIHDLNHTSRIVFTRITDYDRLELIRLLYTNPTVHARPKFYPFPPVIKSLMHRVFVS